MCVLPTDFRLVTFRQKLRKFDKIDVSVRKVLHYSGGNCPASIFIMSTPPTFRTGEGEILTVKEVAEHLKVTDRTIYRLAGAKKIPAFKVGGTWRFSRADIDAWIRRQSAEPLDGDGPGNADGASG